MKLFVKIAMNTGFGGDFRPQDVSASNIRGIRLRSLGQAGVLTGTIMGNFV